MEEPVEEAVAGEPAMVKQASDAGERDPQEALRVRDPSELNQVWGGGAFEPQPTRTI